MWGLVPLSARTRLVRGLAASTAALLLLAACAQDDNGGDDGTGGENGSENGSDEAPAGDVEMPEAAPDFGADAAITFPDAEPPAGLEVEVLYEGDGDMVAPEAAVLANYAGHVWGEDTPFDSSFERGAPTMFSLTGVVQGWSDGIPEHPIGSRLMISIPPELGYGPSGGNANAGIGAEDTIVFLVDLHAAANPEQTGSADAEIVADLDELPVEIDGEPGEPATVSVRDGEEESSEPTFELIAQGSGPPLAEGDSAAFAYSLTTWDNAESESSWPQISESGPPAEVGQMGMGQWYDLLLEVPVGSRALITLPGSEQGPGLAIVTDVVLSDADAGDETDSETDSE